VLKRSKRIHGRTLVQQILKEGCPHSGPFLNAISFPNGLGHTRYAVLVGKKIAPGAVDRNQKRRQIYEILRLKEQKEAGLSTPSLDIVLLIKRPAVKASFSEMQSALHNTLRFLA
jgi:ribonuclease P protein component